MGKFGNSKVNYANRLRKSLGEFVHHYSSLYLSSDVHTSLSTCKYKNNSCWRWEVASEAWNSWHDGSDRIGSDRWSIYYKIWLRKSLGEFPLSIVLFTSLVAAMRCHPTVHDSCTVPCNALVKGWLEGGAAHWESMPEWAGPPANQPTLTQHCSPPCPAYVQYVQTSLRKKKGGG